MILIPKAPPIRPIRATVGGAFSNSGLLPKLEGMRVERSGDQRYLVVKGSADKPGRSSKEFWTEMGFVIRREDPGGGCDGNRLGRES